MKKFILIWSSEFISSIGSGMTSFALSIYVYQTTGSVSLVSLVTLLAFLPTILLSPVGGVLADRYDRRLLMVIGDFFSGLGVLYMLCQIQAGNTSILPILIGVTFSSVFVSLLEPSYRATVTDLLTEEEYTKASGMVQVAGNAKYLISPALAGILLAVSDIRLIFCIDILTFVFTVFTVMTARKTMKKPVKRNTSGMKKELTQGFHVITKNNGVKSLVIIMTVVCFFMGFVQTLSGPMVLAVSDAKTVGILESVCAIGMLVGSLWIGIAGIKRNHAGVLAKAGVLCGIFIMLAGVNRNLIFTGASIFMFFLCMPFMNSCADVLIRVSIPNDLQGRAWGMISLLTQMGTVIAYAVCGVLSDYIFEPMMAENGILSGSIGRLIGIGEGRGIGLLLMVSGIGLILSCIWMGRNRAVQMIQIRSEV